MEPIDPGWRRRFEPGDWFLEPCGETRTLLGVEVRRSLHTEQSPFQRIEVLESHAMGNVLVLDGVLMLTERDHFFYHEMLSHPALFTHARPQHVAVIGGGDCGCVREVLRHETVESLLLIELDERVTRVAERFFPELCAANRDSRLHFEFTDGITWMERMEPESLDVVLVDSTDPVGQAARLFGREFYAQCARVLGESGVLAVQSLSPFVHTAILGRIRGAMRAAGFASVTTLHFPQPTYFPGWWSVTVAGGCDFHEAFREGDASRHAFPTRYYNAEVHRCAAAVPEFLRRALA